MKKIMIAVLVFSLRCLGTSISKTEAAQKPSNSFSISADQLSDAFIDFFESEGIVIAENDTIQMQVEIILSSGGTYATVNSFIFTTETDETMTTDIISFIVDELETNLIGTPDAMINSSTPIDFTDCPGLTVHGTAYYNKYTDYSISRSYYQPYSASFKYFGTSTASSISVNYYTIGWVFSIPSLQSLGYYDDHSILVSQFSPGKNVTYSNSSTYTGGAFLTTEGFPAQQSLEFSVVSYGTTYSYSIPF